MHNELGDCDTTSALQDSNSDNISLSDDGEGDDEQQENRSKVCFYHLPFPLQ